MFKKIISHFNLTPLERVDKIIKFIDREKTAGFINQTSYDDVNHEAYMFQCEFNEFNDSLNKNIKSLIKRDEKLKKAISKFEIDYKYNKQNPTHRNKVISETKEVREALFKTNGNVEYPNKAYYIVAKNRLKYNTAQAEKTGNKKLYNKFIQKDLTIIKNYEDNLKSLNKKNRKK